MTSNSTCLTYFILALLFHLVSNLLKQPRNDLGLRDAFKYMFCNSSFHQSKELGSSICLQSRLRAAAHKLFR